MIEDLLALVRDARALIGAPPDDPRRADLAARKEAIVHQLGEN